MQYSIATVCLSGTLRQKIEAIAKAGFQGIEIFENDLITHDGCLSELGSLRVSHRDIIQSMDCLSVPTG